MTQPAPNNLLQSIAAGERPQERLEAHGPTSLSDAELLAMLLRSGTKGNDVLTLSHKLLAEAGSLHSLTHWSDQDFRRLKGIGKIKALQLITVMEIARRVLRTDRELPPLLESPLQVADYLRPRLAGMAVEKFWVLCLNRKNRLLRCVEITSGTANSTLAHPREVFRAAIRESASAVICAHNHPSGDPAPSSADIRITRQLREASHTVDIPLLDHVIVGQIGADPRGTGHYSFRESGML